ncbi:MAG TPA: DNA adenine methylase [Kofleriaceae bacterium]|nr:DNA adenine methylase [Kofleriaceae bacterium]
MPRSPTIEPAKLTRYASPLRYPGGKAKLANFIAALVERNSLAGGHYVEPYAGGASVALALVLRGLVSRAYINDVDPAVYSFWHSVIREPEALCRLIADTKVTVDEWQRQKLIQRDHAGHSTLSLGFSTFFLNRTNRSGIISSAGMIGGAGQAGSWKLDARYNKAELIARIERIARVADRLRLYRSDAAKLLQRLIPKLSSKSFMYLDPPYYVKGTSRLYANCYEHNDHLKIAELVRTARTPWLVSYDDQVQIRAMYAGFRCRRFHLRYTARDRYEGAEVLVFSNLLRVPRSIV